MKRFVVGEARGQSTLFPARVDDFIAEDHPVRVIDVFVEELDLRALGFDSVDPHTTGRPAYHPATLLKIYIYGYLNRIQSSRRLEREAQRNLELMWLTERLAPDFKTIADFRKDNGKAIRRVCRQFVVLCRQLNLFAEAMVAIDGSKFKAVNNRDKNFTPHKLQARNRHSEAGHGIDQGAVEGGGADGEGAGKMSNPKVKGVEVEMGSGNVYADLGFADADEMLIKAQLVSKIAEIIKRKGLTQTQAAQLLGMPQPKLSNLLSGRFRGVSERRLMDCLVKLGRDVQIVVKATPRSRKDGRLSIVFA